MKINCPCSEGEMWLAFWWLMEPCVFCRCPDSAAVLDQLTRPLWWRNHFFVSLVLQSPAFLAVAWVLLLFLCRSLFHEWDEPQFRPCAYVFVFFFPIEFKVSRAYMAKFVDLWKGKGYTVGGSDPCQNAFPLNFMKFSVFAPLFIFLSKSVLLHSST